MLIFISVSGKFSLRCLQVCLSSLRKHRSNTVDDARLGRMAKTAEGQAYVQRSFNRLEK